MVLINSMLQDRPVSATIHYRNSKNNPQKVVADHDVFLSFRGEDTGTDFTSYLYHALDTEGIKTFFDREKLMRGKAISTELMKAIQGSRSLVVVLSENYAFSSWCLIELTKIVECMDTLGLIVLPIFYHVNPSHVRNLGGSYREAFEKHENNPKLDSEEVETWRDALKRVRNLAGWPLDERYVDYYYYYFFRRKKKNFFSLLFQSNLIYLLLGKKKKVKKKKK